MYSCLGNLKYKSTFKKIPLKNGEGDLLISDNIVFTNEHYKYDDVPINVKFVGSTAKYIQMINPDKGTQVYVQGYFKYETWSQDGVEHNKTVLICEKVKVTGQPNGVSNNDVTSAEELLND